MKEHAPLALVIVMLAGLCPAWADAVMYENPQYGFRIPLPDSWQGYAIITDEWEGYDNAGGTGSLVDRGPIIKLRNPLWTRAAPYEDLPVMVFTPAQWVKVQAEDIGVGAAPVPPSELGHNSRFVLALPARYNWDYATGYEEVDRLVHGLQAFEPTTMRVPPSGSCANSAFPIWRRSTWPTPQA